MPFGKYAHRTLDEIPLDYLRWAVEHARAEWLRDALAEEIHRRERAHADHHSSEHAHDTTTDPPPRSNGIPTLATAQEFVTAALHSLARRYHPDAAGGDSERMIAINNCADWFRMLARRYLH